MRNALLNILAAPRSAGRAETAAACARTLGPLAAPFLILVCEPRWELALTAACWSVAILPGLLAVNVFFSPGHPLGRGVARLAVASVAGMFPFALVAWTACQLHWTLTPVLLLYAVLYAVCLLALIRRLIRRGPVPDSQDARTSRLKLFLEPSRWYGLIVLVGVTVILAAVVLLEADAATPKTRGPWWRGVAWGASASVVSGVVILVALGRGRVAPTNVRARSSKRRGKTSRPHKVAPTTDAHGIERSPTASLALLLWAGAVMLTLYVMKVSYALPTPDSPRPAWNSDDVTFVSQAVDYRYGLPLGKWESSVGSHYGLDQAALSPLVAPLVAALSRTTGVGCAALQHSVMPPLMILLGTSALAAALSVVLRGHRWAVPLGLLVVLMVICKSIEYDRSFAQFIVYRAMQDKSVHLSLIHPLQLASLLLLACRPNRRHLLAASVVAVVGHCVHPFSTVLGAVWTASTSAVSAVFNRRALLKLLILLMVYGIAGGGYYVLSKQSVGKGRLSSGRTADSPQQSRDLRVVDGEPTLLQDPRIAFGYNLVYALAVLALPTVAAMGRRHTEFVYLGLIGLVAVGCGYIDPLARLLNVALPMSILWRTRWMVPSLASIAALAFVAYWAICLLIRRRDGSPTGARSFLAAVLVVGAFGATLHYTRGETLRPGPDPRQLSKFSADMQGLVDLLGGVQAAPFVWGPREVTRELPQLMPNIKLVLSRRKLMRPADDPEFRKIVLVVRELFRRGQVNPAYFRRLLALYPVDHVVLDYGEGAGRQPAQMLAAEGWERVGRSGRYEVWRIGRVIGNIHSSLNPGGVFACTEVFPEVRTHAGPLVLFRSTAEIEDVLRTVGFEILSQTLLFALISDPVGSPGLIPKVFWAAPGLANHFEPLGLIAGSLLYPIKLMPVFGLSHRPPAEIMLCRKAGPERR